MHYTQKFNQNSIVNTLTYATEFPMIQVGCMK